MLRKNKIIITVTILCLVVIAIALIVASLDRLDFENYGLNYSYVTANFTDTTVYESGLHFIGFSNVLLEVPKTERHISLRGIKTYTNDFFSLQVDADVNYAPSVPSDGQF